MRRVFTGFAVLLALSVVVQFFSAATGAFDTASNDESFEMHRSLGYGTMLLALLATVVAAVARMPGKLIGMVGLIAGLVLVQSLIRILADALGDSAGTLAFGLHALNGLAIMSLAGVVVRQARTLKSPVT